MGTRTYVIAGLTCPDCAERIRSAVCDIDGVSECRVDAGSGLLSLSFVTPEPPTAAVARIVQAEGFALAERHVAAGGFLRFVLSRRDTRFAVGAAFLTLLGLVAPFLGASPWVTTPLLALAILLGGLPIAGHAFQELWRAHSLGMNTLMVIAVAGAAAIGEWAEAAVVVALFSLGEALEGFAADRARSALSNLLDLAPPTALRLLPDGGVAEVAVTEVGVGERVLVRSGDRVGVDGVVRAGQSAVDQSPITGESAPVEKGPGDPVYAGTINTAAALEVEVTRPAADTTLSRMVHMAQEAQARRAPIQRFVDRFARVYTPAVAVLALLAAVLPPLLFAQPFWGTHGWLMRALQLLVIACPCALVLSTPVSLVSAMTAAASRGVLIKGGRYLEALGRVRAVAFDKTGTLTSGCPVATDVVDVCTCGACPEDCGLQHAAALEARSSHPLGRALVAEAQARRLTVPPARDVVAMGGRGVQGVVNGAQVTVASHTYFDQHFPHPPSVCRLADDLAAQGKTVVLVQHDNEVCGLFAIADPPRSASRQVMAELHADGFHTVMLSGDNPIVAAEIGAQVGIAEVRAGLLPDEKVAAIAALRQQYGPVAMVGDGVNDAPALAGADVGIAMGGAGSDQAMEAADVVLMGDDLTRLPDVFRLSRRTRRTVAVNIVFSLLVKAGVFILAIAGLATMWMAVAADVGASLMVILNGMRLRRIKGKR